MQKRSGGKEKRLYRSYGWLRSNRIDLENWDETPQVWFGGFCTKSPITNLQVSRSWRDIMPKKRNIDLLPQASNDYRFANGFQGRMFNLKRSAGAPVKVDFESLDEAPKVCSFCSRCCSTNSGETALSSNTSSTH